MAGCARPDIRYSDLPAEAGQVTAAIEAAGLVKDFGKTKALAGVDLAAAPGTVLGVLGPNGAGKTTADRFRSLPIARWAPLAGAIMGDVTRYVISPSS
jgi:oleandomycin transport system ATP-binding protein